MGSVTIDVELPEAVLECYGSREAVRKVLSQSAVLELVRRGEMSSRRAAELVGMEWLDFVRLMGGQGINYFTEEAFQQDLAAVAEMRRSSDRGAG
ncbi:MAG: UPF0175 family protein [Armatimonadetes bacterium]|nr:UPF0175 family protein [Armatimonadota bacterium]